MGKNNRLESDSLGSYIKWEAYWDLLPVALWLCCRCSFIFFNLCLTDRFLSNNVCMPYSSEKDRLQTYNTCTGDESSKMESTTIDYQWIGKMSFSEQLQLPMMCHHWAPSLLCSTEQLGADCWYQSLVAPQSLLPTFLACEVVPKLRIQRTEKTVQESWSTLSFNPWFGFTGQCVFPHQWRKA